MFEVLIDGEPLNARRRLVRLVRRAIDPQRCIVMTRAERLARAFFWFALGGMIFSFGHAWRDLNFPAPVAVLPPRVEHAGERLTIVLFGFEHRGGVAHCRLVLDRNNPYDWSIRC